MGRGRPEKFPSFGGDHGVPLDLSTRVRKYGDECRGDFGCWGRRSSRARLEPLPDSTNAAQRQKRPVPRDGAALRVLRRCPNAEGFTHPSAFGRLALPPVALPHTSLYLRIRVLSPPNQSGERDFGLPAPLRSAANPKQLTLNVLRTEYGSEPYVI